MKKFLAKVLVGLASLSLMTVDAEACTAILVTKGASADGSVFVAHSDDGYDGDPNVTYISAKNHKAGTMRAIYPSAVAVEDMPEYNCSYRPHLVAPERDAAYNFPGLPATKPIGYIPEVEHTYAYIDAEYPIMNEHGLMLGECTDNSAHLEKAPYTEGGGIFYSSELGRVALERCKTAREAIKLMGELIDEYGLYGTAETLFVADKNEGWILEMQPTPSGKGGFWIAEKIPDGEVSVAANQLRIQTIREDDPNQIFNPKLPQMLKDVGWAAYDEQGNLNWIKSLQGEEMYCPYYSLRRVWRALSLVAPSKNFSPKVDNYDSDYYPLSVRPDKKLTVADVMNIYRDYYQGTEFDMTESKFAGLFGSPYAYYFDDETGTERSILSEQTLFVDIAQVNDKLPTPIFWLSTNTPAENPFVPFAVAKMPDTYNRVMQTEYDETKMWWVSNQVTSITRGYWNTFIPTVTAAVEKSESDSLKLVESSLNLNKNKFAATLNKNAVKVFDDWKNLYTKLLVQYCGGAGLQYDKRHVPDNEAPTEY